MEITDVIIVGFSLLGIAASISVLVHAYAGRPKDLSRVFNSLTEVGPLLRRLDGLVIVIDDQNHIRYASPSLRHLMGHDDTTATIEALSTVIDEKTEGERTLKQDDGSVRTIFWRRTRYHSDTHGASGVVLYGNVIETESLMSSPPMTGPRVDVAGKLLEKNSALLRANHSLVQSRTQLQRLVEKLYDIKEREGIRVARELHDELGQILTGLKIETVLLQRKIAKLGATDKTNEKRTDDIVILVDQAIRRVQKLSKELRPPMLDKLGLIATFESVLNELKGQTAARFEMTHDISNEIFSRETLTYAYRVFKETITGLARQANVKHVTIHVEKISDHVKILIQDDGRADPSLLFAQDSVGILGMTEYARKHGGIFSMNTENEAFLSIEVTLPLAPDKNSIIATP